MGCHNGYSLNGDV